jgi:hypothetical protein
MVGSVDAEFPGDGADGLRAVPRDHLDRDVLRREVGERTPCLGPQPLAQHEQRDRLNAPTVAEPFRDRQVRRVGPAKHEQPQPLRGARVGLGTGRIRRRQQDVRRAEHPAASQRARAREHRAAPLARRGERHHVGQVPVPVALDGLRLGHVPGDGLDGGVRPVLGVDQPGQCAADRHPRLQLDQLVQFHARFGERSGLVQAQDVHPREYLDRRQLLDQALAPAQPDHADRESDAGQQHEPFRDHRDDAGHRPRDRVGKTRAGVGELARRKQDGHRHDHPADQLQEAVDAGHQLRAGQVERGGLRLQPGRIGIVAHRRRLVRGGAADHEAAGEHLVARLLGDRVGFASEQRLVNLHPAAGGDLPVDHDPVPGADQDPVTEHDLLRAELRLVSVADNQDLFLAEDAEPVQGPFRP